MRLTARSATRFRFFIDFFSGLKNVQREKIRNENLPLPDPPWLRVESFSGTITSEIPQEIMVFFAYLKRGVGQGQIGKM